MSRHSNTEEINPRIEFLLACLAACTDWLRSALDRPARRMLTYFQTTPLGSIITDFLAFLLVMFLFLYGPAGILVYFILI